MTRRIHKQGSTAMMMRICGDRMKPCYDNQTGECFRSLEVTREIFKRGLVFIADEQAIPDKEGMVEVTFLEIGDIIVITNKGVRRMSQKDFQEKYFFEAHS